MSHIYHEDLPGYHPDQILHDGCPECEYRASRGSHGLTELDTESFARAWKRAAQWNQGGLDNVALAERSLLSALWAVQVQLERLGVPIGTLPVDG
jgi:hypothetical protein